MADALPPLPPNVAVLTGPQLLGALFNWALFGVVASQTYYYYLNFGNDRWTFKALVYGLFLAETIQTGIVGHDVFETLARGWGDPSAIFDSETIWFTGPIMDSLIGATVQIFYGWRIYKLGGSRIVFGAITLLAFGSVGTGIAAGVESSIPSDANVQRKLYPIATAWLVCSAACDTVISLCMLAWYSQIRKNVIRRATSDLITRIIRFTVVSGLMTTAMAIVILAMALAYRSGGNFYFQCPSLVIGKLYSNSLVAMLNQRHKVGEGSMTRYIYESDFSPEPSSNHEQDTAQRRSTARITSMIFMRPRSDTQITTTIGTHPDSTSVELGSVPKIGSEPDSYRNLEVKNHTITV